MLQNKSISERWGIIDELLPVGSAIKAIISAIIHLSCVSTTGVRAVCPFSNVVNMTQILLHVSESTFRSLIRL